MDDKINKIIFEIEWWKGNYYCFSLVNITCKYFEMTPGRHIIWHAHNIE